MRLASYAEPNAAGSDVHCDTVSASPVPISTVRGTRGSSQPSGNAHVTYHGSRTGPSSIRQSSPHPQDAPTSAEPISGRRRQTALATTTTAATDHRERDPRHDPEDVARDRIYHPPEEPR